MVCVLHSHSLIALCLNLSSRKVFFFLTEVFCETAFFLYIYFLFYLPSSRMSIPVSILAGLYTLAVQNAFVIAPRVVVVHVDVRKLDAIVYALMQKVAISRFCIYHLVQD